MSTYEEFIENAVRQLDCYLLELYYDYEENASEKFQWDENFILFENSEIWFEGYFKEYSGNLAGCLGIQNWFYNFKLLKNERQCFKFDNKIIIDFLGKKICLKNVDYTKYQLLDFMEDINYNFIDYYTTEIITFDYLKNLLYNNQIYNEAFAEEVDLK
jgi:hypothetical protein